MKENFAEVFLVGAHKNSLGRSAEVLEEVLKNKGRLPELYDCISNKDAWVRMRAVDTFEKVIREYPEWVDPYLDDIFKNLIKSEQASIQWHLAQIFAYIELNDAQKKKAVSWMNKLLSSISVDWIVAANSMDTLRSFMDEGLLEKSEFKKLLKIQLNHKSKSVVKKANKHLAMLEN